MDNFCWSKTGFVNRFRIGLRPVIPVIVAGFIGLALLLFLFTHGKVIHLEWMMPLLWLLGPLLIIERMLFRCRPEALQHENLKPFAGSLVLLGFALLYLFSNTVHHRWFYFLNWVPANGLVCFDFQAGVVRFVFLTVLCLPFFLFSARRRHWILAGLLILIQVAAFMMLLRSTQGLPLYNDDHPSFMFRLWVFGRTFPRLISYNPFWNAGQIDLTGLSTGTTAPGILFLPIWKYCSVSQFYPYAICVMYLVLVPCLAIISLRIMKCSWVSAWVAGLLALVISRYSMLWLLHYGTIGANFTSAFVMPLSACIYRVVMLNRMEKATGLAIVLSAVFLLMWPPGAVMMLPILFAFLVNFRKWSKEKTVFLGICALVAFILFLYPLLIILRATDVLSHQWVGSGGPASSLYQLVFSGWQHLRAHCRQVHPLLLFMGIGGLFVVPDRTVRKWFIPVVAGFALLTGWGREWIHDLQLSRMAIPLFYVSILPAAILIAGIFSTKHPRIAVLRSAAFALLLMTGLNTALLYANAGEGSYDVISPAIRKLTSWVRQNTVEGKRVMLAGVTGHYYEGGHVPFLPVLFGREMIAYDFSHDASKDIRYGSPPSDPPSASSEMDAYFDSFSVQHVITMHDAWKRFFRSDPERFREVGAVHGDFTFTIFEVRHPASIFLKGRGTVQANMNELDVTLENPTEEAVIKYNWVAGLSAPNAEIFPFETGLGVRLVGIRPHGERHVRIRFRPWLCSLPQASH